LADDILNILFVSPDNSSRSIMAESLLNKIGRGSFKAYSAGSAPNGKVNVFATETLKQAGYDVSGVRSKSWNEFATLNAPRIDAVIMLYEAEKRERFPIWYSDPIVVCWKFKNAHGAHEDETKRRYAFRRLYGDIEQQILKLMSLNLGKAKGDALVAKLKSIAP